MKDRLDTLKSLLAYELKDLNFLSEKQQLEFLSNLRQVLIFKKGIIEQITEDVNFIGTDKFHEENFTLNTLKLNLIKTITEL